MGLFEQSRRLDRPILFSFSPVVKAPGLLGHVIAVVIERCPGPATTATTLELACSAAAFISLGAKLLEGLTGLPDFVEGAFPYVTGFDIQVGARLDFPTGTDDAVSQSRKTTPAETGRNPHQ